MNKSESNNNNELDEKGIKFKNCKTIETIIVSKYLRNFNSNLIRLYTTPITKELMNNSEHMEKIITNYVFKDSDNRTGDSISNEVEMYDYYLLEEKEGVSLWEITQLTQEFYRRLEHHKTDTWERFRYLSEKRNKEGISKELKDELIKEEHLVVQYLSEVEKIFYKENKEEGTTRILGIIKYKDTVIKEMNKELREWFKKYKDVNKELTIKNINKDRVKLLRTEIRDSFIKLTKQDYIKDLIIVKGLTDKYSLKGRIYKLIDNCIEASKEDKERIKNILELKLETGHTLN